MLPRIGKSKADKDRGLTRLKCCHKRHGSAGLPRSTDFTLAFLWHRLYVTVRSNPLFAAEGGVVTDGPRHGGSGREGRGFHGSQGPRSGPACLSMLVGSGQVTYQDAVTGSLYPNDVATRPRLQPSMSA
jgi:hypothetical protein